MTCTDLYALMFFTGAALAILFPQETYLVMMKIVIEIELMFLNWKTHRLQRRLHKQLCEDLEMLGLDPPPPFEFVRIQDRER